MATSSSSSAAAAEASLANPLLLTDRMRAAVRESHKSTRQLVSWKLALVLTSRPLYGESIALFEPIFEFLEAAVQRHESLKPLGRVVAPLQRSCGFEKDILYYTGAPSREKKPSEVVAKYLQHLESLEKQDATLLVAYVFALYMGVFGGGPVIRKMVQRAFGLSKDAEEGVALFAIPGKKLEETEEERRTAIKESIKSCMNQELKLTDEQVEAIVKEAPQVFAWNDTLVASVVTSDSMNSAVSKCTKWTAVAASAIVAIVAAVAFSGFWKLK